MAYVFKGIDKSKIINESTKVHKSFSLSSSLDAISSVKFRSASYSDTSLNKLSDVGNHWHFLMLNFYLSGSDKASADKKYNYSYHTNVLKNTQIPQHLNKFYSSGSVIYIPQKYFGEDIKPGSFSIVDSSDSNGNIEIKDDGFGNLYPVNNRHSQSADTSISSSDNYVGNIFYNLGVVAFTETGSYSGSVNYTSIGDNFTINFDSTQTIYTTEYSIDKLQIKPGKGKVIIVDDVLATGGTLKATNELCQKAGYEIIDNIVLIDLQYIPREGFDIGVKSFIQYE